MKRLDGKVAIVTGAGAGIGRATAVLFAREGAKVVVVCRTAQNGEQTVETIREVGGEARYVEADVSQAEDVKRMVKRTVESYGKLDILFNNAGVLGDFAPITECTEENFDKTIAINLRSVFLGMKYAIPEMVKAGGGSIINNSSIGAEVGPKNLAAYSASKGGIHSISRVAAAEFGAFNIRVNCVKPSCVDTGMVSAHDPTVIKPLLSYMPRGRLGTPEEVAQLVLFLASDESAHITGEGIVIDGGIIARHP